MEQSDMNVNFMVRVKQITGNLERTTDIFYRYEE